MLMPTTQVRRRRPGGRRFQSGQGEPHQQPAELLLTELAAPGWSSSTAAIRWTASTRVLAQCAAEVLDEEKLAARAKASEDRHGLLDEVLSVLTDPEVADEAGLREWTMPTKLGSARLEQPEPRPRPAGSRADPPKRVGVVMSTWPVDDHRGWESVGWTMGSMPWIAEEGGPSPEAASLLPRWGLRAASARPRCCP